MESIAIYIFKSVIWLTVFSVVYYLFLRNERFFILNRVYLVTGLLGSLLFPLVTIRYDVIIPILTGTAQFELPTISGVETTEEAAVSWQMILFAIFTIGALYFLIRLTVQSFQVLRIIRQSDNEILGNIKVIKTDVFPTSFSFFSYVFVSPSTPETEKREIVTHEAEHIRQHHWFDLILAELLRIIQWFNPMAWIYSHFIRQNHEYLADQMALRKTEDPAIYKAVLLNQLLGGEVIRLGHLFSYSLNKKRFTMMKNTTIPTIKKLKMLLIIPAMTLVFYAFAKPDYKYEPSDNSEQVATKVISENHLIASEKTKIKGIVVQENGKPLHGTSVIVIGTHTGTISDKDGHFELNGIEKNVDLAFSFVGYKTVRVPASFGTELKIVMVQDNIEIKGGSGIHVIGYSSEQESKKTETANNKTKIQTEKVIIKTTSQPDSDKKPLFILDGKEISAEEMSDIAPESIESINVLKDASSKEKYGEKAAHGVVEIFSKKKSNQEKSNSQIVAEEKPTFFVVEQMPQFPGGEDALMQYLANNIKYPEEAQNKGIQGKVFIQFVISETGKVGDLKVFRSVHPLLDLEAWRVVENMPDWIPGKQRNQNVRVSFTIPVNFNLEKKAEKKVN